MEFGKLRHRVIIQNVSEGVDAYGSPTETFSDLVTLQCSIEHITGREYFAGDHVNSDAEYKITTHWYAGVKQGMKLKFGTRTFDILNVYNVSELNREMIITCKEIF